MVPCQEAHKSFTPLVFLVDGMEGVEVKAAQKQLDLQIVSKWRGTMFRFVDWFGLNFPLHWLDL